MARVEAYVGPPSNSRRYLVVREVGEGVYADGLLFRAVRVEDGLAVTLTCLVNHSQADLEELEQAVANLSDLGTP